MKTLSIKVPVLFLLLAQKSAWADDYYFDKNLLRGSEISADLLDNRDPLAQLSPGEHSFDVYLNGNYIANMELQVTKNAAGTAIQFDRKQLTQLSIKESWIAKLDEHAKAALPTIIKDAGVEYDSEKVAVKLSIPQSYLLTLPKGYVPESVLDKGTSIGFVNYDANQFHVHTKGSQASDYNSTFLDLNGGINFGLWRVRSQGSMNKTDNTTAWSSARTYLQRAIPQLKSEMTLGKTFTNGQFFSSLGYEGVSIATDERMIPDSVRRYSPSIHGIANSNAKVSVYQHGHPIYQTVVPPGSFTIDDLSAITNGGDLTVTVTESDGTTKNFTVPYSAIPGSMRPGYGKYSFNAGRLTTYHDEYFTEGTYQYGLSNSITSSVGLRVAKQYTSGSLGSVYTSFLGSFGLDFGLSSTTVQSNDEQGFMLKMSYNKSFQDTGTNIGFAGYKYSSSGYRELSDVVSLRNHPSDIYYSTSYSQKNRFEVNLSQTLDTYGSLFLSGAVQSYREADRPDDTQYQFGYSNTLFRNLSFSLNAARQRTHFNSSASRYGYYTDYVNRRSGVTETMYQLSMSMPLGSEPNSPYASVFYSHSDKGDSALQSSLSGNLLRNNDLHYNLAFSRQGSEGNTLGGGIDGNHRYGNFGATFSNSKKYYQLSATARGAVAIHSGGITAGPYLGETFGLVEAKGAEGALLSYGQQSRIDGRGYALVPSIQPYRYNAISIDTTGMDDNVELLDSQRNVAPYAGASVLMKFRTLSGYGALVNINTADKRAIPIGTLIRDSKGNEVGMMGRINQAYVRVSSLEGTLHIGDSKQTLCEAKYKLPDNAKDSAILQTTSYCQKRLSS